MAKQFPKNLYARVYDRAREVRDLVKSERAATIENANAEREREAESIEADRAEIRAEKAYNRRNGITG